MFSNWQFWLTLCGTVMICLVPVIFYFTAQALMFPSLKDLIVQKRLKPEIIDEVDP